MKFIDALKNVIKTQRNESYLNWDELSRLCGVDQYSVDFNNVEQRLKCYWLETWICTDTSVGVSAVFLDDELVAWSEQVARKSDYNMTFINVDTQEKVRQWIIANTKPEDLPSSVATEDELNKEISTNTSVYYVDHLPYGLKDGWYEGAAVKIVSKKDGYAVTSLTVEFCDSKIQKKIKVEEFEFPLNISVC